MPLSSFADNFAKPLADDHPAGGAVFLLYPEDAARLAARVAAAGFPAVGPGNPLRFTVLERGAEGLFSEQARYAVYLATGLDTATGELSGLATVEGTTDQDFYKGDVLAVLWTAGAIRELQEAATGGAGSVTSVGLAAPGGFGVTGSPVTGAGTLTLTTSLAGVVKAAGGAFLVAVAGTDYLAPGGSGAALTGITPAQVGTYASSIIDAMVAGRQAQAATLDGLAAATYPVDTLLAGAGTGVPGPVTVGSGLSLAAGVLSATGGGGGTPGGTDQQVQFNNGGAFGGAVGLTYDQTTNVLTLGSAYPIAAQLVVRSNGGDYGHQGLKLWDNAGGNVVVLQAVGGNSLYVTNGAGGTAPIQVATLSNPNDSSTLNLAYHQLYYTNVDQTQALFNVGGSVTYGQVTSHASAAGTVAFAADLYAGQTAPAFGVFAATLATVRPMGGLCGSWASNVDASRSADVFLVTDGYNGQHEGIRLRDAGTFAQPIIPVANVRDAADDAAAAALAPAVPVGGLYRSGSILKIRVT